MHVLGRVRVVLDGKACRRLGCRVASGNLLQESGKFGVGFDGVGSPISLLQMSCSCLEVEKCHMWRVS